ncbi:6019_t:CDS:1 [Dentiscutata erythropus]|uniref:6019_t:CDS:1 n=1 Tax=Dentiscutata erythropus TaxID=1348616 RepID=A0A9N9P017_9GLOM|nr:6019_t:CDS:1 [Dentiscutata erythropus]
MSDPESDEIKPSLSKDDWKQKFIERIRNPSYYEKTKPSLPNSPEPELWGKYRKNLSEYLEYSMYFEPIRSELHLIDSLIFQDPSADDNKIISEYTKTLIHSKSTPNTKLSREIDTNPYSYYKNVRKKSRNKRFAKNLLAATRELENSKYDFFERAKFPMSIITDKNITSIINEYKTIMKIDLKRNVI